MKMAYARIKGFEVMRMFRKGQSGSGSRRRNRGKLTYVNMAEWESAEHFQAAIRREEFKKLTKGSSGSRTSRRSTA